MTRGSIRLLHWRMPWDYGSTLAVILMYQVLFSVGRRSTCIGETMADMYDYLHGPLLTVC